MDKNSLHNIVAEEAKNICQIVAYKQNEKVYSDTWNDYKESDACHVMSVTKSVVSLLIGIAIGQRLIRSVEQKVLDFFPEYQMKRGEKTIQQVTLKHLLTMTAPYKYKSEPWTKVCLSDDWTKAALDLLGGRAGMTGTFKYSTLGIHILTGIIAKTSGMNPVDYANTYLFEPLGIEKHQNYLAETKEEHVAFTLSKEPKEKVWFCDPKGVGTAGYGLCLSAADMAKIGQIYLNKGMYGNQRIVSERWIEESTCPHFQCDEKFQNMSYGYLWWVLDKDRKRYAAIGDGGNVIYVNTEDSIVITVAATFKPAVYDRIPFIQKYVEPFILNI